MAVINYINTQLNIGLEDWQNAWLLNPPVKLITENFRGALVFRVQGTTKRYSYNAVKKNLQKKQLVIKEEGLPF